MDRLRPRRARVEFARLFWIFFGPLLIILLTGHIALDGTGWHTSADYVFFLILGGIVFARWFEFREGNAMTATGESATHADVTRFTWIVAIAGTCVWILANAFGNRGGL